jgi:hypothetical protein
MHQVFIYFIWLLTNFTIFYCVPFMQLSSVLLLIRYCTVLQRIHPFFSCLVWFCEEKNVYQVQHTYCAHWDIKKLYIFYLS